MSSQRPEAFLSHSKNGSCTIACKVFAYFLTVPTASSSTFSRWPRWVFLHFKNLGRVFLKNSLLQSVYWKLSLQMWVQLTHFLFSLGSMKATLRRYSKYCFCFLSPTTGTHRSFYHSLNNLCLPHNLLSSSLLALYLSLSGLPVSSFM